MTLRVSDDPPHYVSAGAPEPRQARDDTSLRTKGTPVFPKRRTSYNFVLPFMPFPTLRWGKNVLNLEDELSQPLLCGHKELQQ